MEADAAPRKKREHRPSFKFEREAGCVVCGVDEVGCAPLAGPVVAAAVILPSKGLPRKLAMLINDSKIVPAPKREVAAAALPDYCVIGFGEASVEEIDALNIYHARMLAMCRAVAGLSTVPELALIDGNATPRDLACKSRTIVDGDAKCLSIAAASIVAKVFRDAYMRKALGNVSRLRLGKECRLRHARASRGDRQARHHAAPSPELRTYPDAYRATALSGRTRHAGARRS